MSISILIKDGPRSKKRGPPLSANIYRSLNVKYFCGGKTSSNCHIKAKATKEWLKTQNKPNSL